MSSPDHDTIATFRRRFLRQIQALFVDVLKLAREMGLLKLGTVALDGTKMHANASRHSALSYEQAGKIEAQLKAEVADLLAKAEAADQADVPDGMSVPAELARRETRLRRGSLPENGRGRRSRRALQGNVLNASRPSIEGRSSPSVRRKSKRPAKSLVAGDLQGRRRKVRGHGSRSI